MLNNKGFTLLEVLMALTLWLIIVLISISFNSSSSEKKQEEQFMETLEFDVLYIQNLAMTTSSSSVQLLFYDGEYIIYEGSTPLIKRNFPSEWKINDGFIRPLSFYNNGTIRQPGTMTITLKHSKYQFVFPFGKGRGYIEKQ